MVVPSTFLLVLMQLWSEGWFYSELLKNALRKGNAKDLYTNHISKVSVCTARSAMPFVAG